MLKIIARMSRYSFIILAVYLVFMLFIPLRSFSSHGSYNLPKLPAPEEYGDVLIDKFSSAKKVMPVVFSHWVHRPKFTCRVCHVELDFSMKAGDTAVVCGGGEVTGKSCTVCHDGKTSFAPKDSEGKNCDRCHNANASPNRKKFEEMKAKLPKSGFGDGIDWSKALTDGLIQPKNSLKDGFQPMVIATKLSLAAEMSGIPPATFPHEIHAKWLDCDMCHPDIFNIKKKTTKHFAMSRILNKEFCGVCHLRIAFPLDDCKRCHPGMK